METYSSKAVGVKTTSIILWVVCHDIQKLYSIVQKGTFSKNW